MILLSVATAAVAQSDASASLTSFLPLVAVFFVFYFLIMKPQQRRFKEHQAMIGAIKKGDQVMTTGGIIGRINKIDVAEDVVYLDIADAVTIKVSKPTIVNIYGVKTTAEIVKKTKKASVANDN